MDVYLIQVISRFGPVNSDAVTGAAGYPGFYPTLLRPPPFLIFPQISHELGLQLLRASFAAHGKRAFLY
jgi:hypothetical protein